MTQDRDHRDGEEGRGGGGARTDRDGGDTHADRHGGDAQAPPPGRREYRMAELAAEAGVTTRTVRFYRERKLLPPPRREGRIAWYDEHHLARLHTIAGLLDRGHTLGGIADLMDAFESGRDSRGTAELLGLDAALSTPFAEETPVRITPEELAGYYPGEVTPENLATSLDIGYIAVDGDEFIHVSRRLLDASSALVHMGIPLSAVLAAGQVLRSEADTIAAVFADIFRRHLLLTGHTDEAEGSGETDGTGGSEGTDEPEGSEGTPGPVPRPEALDPEHINALLTRLHPLAKQVVEAELGLALDRRVRTEIDDWLTGG